MVTRIDNALLTQCFDVLVDGSRGREAELFCDLAIRRRVAILFLRTLRCNPELLVVFL